MLVLDLSPAYFAPVRLPILDAYGALTEIKFDAQFRRLSHAELKAYMEDASLSKEQAVRQVMVGWKLVMDKDGLPVSFGDENFARLLNIPGASNAIWEGLLLSAYRPEEAISAQGQGPEAAEKN